MSAPPRICLLTCLLRPDASVVAWIRTLDERLRARGITLVLLHGHGDGVEGIPGFAVPFSMTLMAELFPAPAVMTGRLPAPLVEALTARLALLGQGDDEHARRGLASCTALAELLCERLAPEAALFWSDTAPLSRVCKRVFEDHGIPSWFIERGFCADTLMIEPYGQSGLSELTASFALSHIAADSPAEREAYAPLRDYVLHQAPAKYPQPGRVRAAELRDRLALGPDRLVLYLGHLDALSGTLPPTYPESQRHAPGFPTTAAALDAVVRAAQAIGGCRVAFRPHPHAGHAALLASRPDIIPLNDVHLHSAIEAADVVAGQMTTALFDALLMDKPIVTLARHVIAGKDVTYDALTPDRVEGALRDALERRDFARRSARGEQLTGFIARHFLIGTRPDVPGVRPLDDLAAFIAGNALWSRSLPADRRLAVLDELPGPGRTRLAQAAGSLAASAAELRREGQARAARALARHALELLPRGDRGATWSLTTYIDGSASRELGDIAEACRAFEALIAQEQVAPEYAAGARFHLAVLREEAGDRAGARRLLTACLAILPGHRAAAEALARLRARDAREGTPGARILLVPLLDAACTNPADRRRVELVWHALRRRGFDAAIVTADEAAAAEADIVISQNRDFPFWNRHAPRLRRRGTRLIFSCSDLLATDTVSWSHSEESYRHKGLPWDSTQIRAGLAEFLPHCEHVFVGSRPQAMHLRAIAGESCPPISIDGDPIDLENYDASCVPAVVQGGSEHAASGQPFRMIWEGYVDNVPHLIVCAEAVRRLASEIPVTVVVVTSRERRTPFFGTCDNQVLAERLLGAEIVEFHEWTPAAIAPLMRSAHAGLSPAFLDDTFNAARPPNKAILVNHMGLPVVASPTDANRGFVTDGINGFLADSSDEWYAALRTLAFDRKAVARMARQGREKAAAFHPDAVAGRMLAALGELPFERVEDGVRAGLPGELPRVVA